ncbi:Bifunctional protein FolD 2 [Citrus sinensis]|uniref:Bifunctional protein FolD 2 n=1 Tax=Citrus sinensis TaxID=2711 RepID=A0ACB8MK98_CITSI|nr:Bifunctional protein FolD 2 [Citrus sinensis]
MAAPSDQKATIIDGKAVAQTIRSEIAEEVRLLSEKYGKVPGLAVVIVGGRKDSQSYVSMKRKACAEVGIKSFDIDLPEQVSEAELISKVHELNGCLELLKRSGVTIKGKRAVVVGRSNIVGLPVSLLLLKADATVTIVHSHTTDPESIVREADIVIAAAGQAMMIKGSWIKPGAAVIDVGTNAVDDSTKKSGYRLVGDVDFHEACKVAGCVTPVPGGVGPMTVAMLLRNTLDGAKRVIEL